MHIQKLYKEEGPLLEELFGGITQVRDLFIEQMRLNVDRWTKSCQEI